MKRLTFLKTLGVLPFVGKSVEAKSKKAEPDTEYEIVESHEHQIPICSGYTLIYIPEINNIIGENQQSKISFDIARRGYEYHIGKQRITIPRNIK